MYSVKITKRENLETWDNSTCSGAYYLVHGRIYDDTGSGYYKFKFVLFFDFAVDLWDPETETNVPLAEALENAISAFVPDADFLSRDYGRRAFYRDCNDSIERYNERLRRGRGWY